MFTVTVDDVVSRLPIEVTDEQRKFIEVRIEDSIDLIREAFMRRGRNFDKEAAYNTWLPLAAKRIVREMVAGAVIIGPHAGARSVSSTTGPQSDSVTYTDSGQWVKFSGVDLTDLMLFELGLVPRGARGAFPQPLRWPEAIRRGWR